MSGRITSAPKAKHYCNAGWHVETDEEVARREQAAAEAPSAGDDRDTGRRTRWPSREPHLS